MGVEQQKDAYDHDKNEEKLSVKSEQNRTNKHKLARINNHEEKNVHIRTRGRSGLNGIYDSC